MILCPALKRWGLPKRPGFCSHPAHLWATSDSVPPLKRGDLPGGMGYVATRHTCGQIFLLSPALKLWGHPRRQGLCSHPAHLWATSNSVVRSKMLWTPQAEGVM